MNYRSVWIVLITFLLSLSPLAVTFSGSVYADEAEASPVAEETSGNGLMTEGELGKVLVNVLGFAPLLPPNPQPVDIFAILMQNEIVPKDGWNPTNYVTMGTLARVLVQSMGQADQVENPDDDGSWVAYLKSIGIEFGTVKEGVDQVKPMVDPVAIVAIEPSTDPLRKVPNIRPSDEQQLGADLQPFSSQLTEEDILRFILEAEPPVPPGPKPITPN